MSEPFLYDLKFNPYTQTIDSDTDKIDNFSWIPDGDNFEDFVDRFFEKNIKSLHIKNIFIKFSGINRDYNFLLEAKSKYEASNPDCKIEIEHKPSEYGNIEPEAKLEQIDNIIKQYKILQDIDFHSIGSNEFEIAAIAPVSNGKSTLLNSMLGHNILPAKLKATTPNIVRIHNNKKLNAFTAIARGIDGHEIANYEDINLSKMNELNDQSVDINDKDYISVIDLYGNIQGIESEKLNLILTDTPGTNNSRNIKHKEHTFSLLKADYKPIILFILTPTFETTDSDNLLEQIKDIMQNSNLHTKDRFIFVLTHVDEIDSEQDGSIESIINNITTYLKQKGISNPKIFPCDSLTAKVIRMKLNGDKISSDKEKNILEKNNIDRIIKNKEKHYSEYAPLSEKNKSKMESLLEDAKNDNDKFKQALIYTGISAIELAISEYLENYAYPSKVQDYAKILENKINENIVSDEELRSKNNKLETKEDRKKKLEEEIKKLKKNKKSLNGSVGDSEKNKIELESNISKKTVAMNELPHEKTFNPIDLCEVFENEDYEFKMNDSIKDIDFDFKEEIIDDKVPDECKRRIEEAQNKLTEAHEIFMTELIENIKRIYNDEYENEMKISGFDFHPHTNNNLWIESKTEHKPTDKYEPKYKLFWFIPVGKDKTKPIKEHINKTYFSLKNYKKKEIEQTIKNKGSLISNMLKNISDKINEKNGHNIEKDNSDITRKKNIIIEELKYYEQDKNKITSKLDADKREIIKLSDKIDKNEENLKKIKKDIEKLKGDIKEKEESNKKLRKLKNQLSELIKI